MSATPIQPIQPVPVIRIQIERPDQPDVAALIASLDAYQGPLYPASSNYHLGVAALAQANVRFAVVRDAQGKAQGCGAVVLHDSYGELKRIYVEPAARGSGLAKLLLRFLERMANENGCPRLRLETGIHQPRAIAFYRRAGYVRCARYGDYPVDALSVYMEKPLRAGPATHDDRHGT